MRIFKESQSVIKELNVVPHTKLYHMASEDSGGWSITPLLLSMEMSI